MTILDDMQILVDVLISIISSDETLKEILMYGEKGDGS
jgi:hypothetical protein